MKSSTKLFSPRLLLALLILIGYQPGYAFYSWQEEDKSLELRGLLRAFATTIQNPDNALLYDNTQVKGIAGVARLIVDVNLNHQLSFEAQAVQSYIPTKLQSRGTKIKRFPDIERSDSLNLSRDNHQARLFLDRLNMQYQSEQLNLKIGRQPINLAASNYFTPNDFFAPFAAQTFYRAYKPGVDAIRADILIGELSQVSLIGVLGYEFDPRADTFWSNNPDWDKNAYIARASTVFQDFEIAILAGSIKRDKIIGLDFQGELFDWLGVRAEGHYFMPNQSNQDNTIEFALGIEHRWENTLTLRFEQFYHGKGAENTKDYNLVSLLPNPDSTYLARHYSAFGASYEMTPLLNTDALVLYNWVDQSRIIAFNAVYSLSDESELVFNLNVPMGERAEGPRIESEFGGQGKSITLEWRQYF